MSRHVPYLSELLHPRWLTDALWLPRDLSFVSKAFDRDTMKLRAHNGWSFIAHKEIVQDKDNEKQWSLKHTVAGLSLHTEKMYSTKANEQTKQTMSIVLQVCYRLTFPYLETWNLPSHSQECKDQADAKPAYAIRKSERLHYTNRTPSHAPESSPPTHCVKVSSWSILDRLRWLQRGLRGTLIASWDRPRCWLICKLDLTYKEYSTTQRVVSFFLLLTFSHLNPRYCLQGT